MPCTTTSAPSPAWLTGATRFGTADQFWGAGGPLSSEWSERVEQTAGYRTALRHTPLRFGMTHTPV
jgi:hypothetical protein